MSIESFVVPYSQQAVDDLRERLAHTRWPDEITGSGWKLGADREFLQDICAYWRDQFDWKAQVEKLSALPHYRYTSDGFGVHFIHVRGKGPSPMPLVITHGWPGSFLEMLRILPLLTDPASHGGNATDAFDLVIPSLPGYGFSDRPTVAGMNSFRVADLWAGMMNELGYRRFGAQGGDLGAAVSMSLGLRHPDHLIGIHLNYVSGSYRAYIPTGSTLSSEEEEFLQIRTRWYDENGAYAHLQATAPQTASYAVNDSPAGLAAWILEKFRAWSDCGGDLYRRFTRDELLANVTLYWMTETIGASFRLYYEGRLKPLQFGEGDFVHAPSAMAHFPGEIFFPPRSYMERGFNVQRWTEMPRGGHFAAAEEPELLAEDLRAFFRGLR